MKMFGDLLWDLIRDVGGAVFPSFFLGMFGFKRLVLRFRGKYDSNSVESQSSSEDDGT